MPGSTRCSRAFCVFAICNLRATASDDCLNNGRWRQYDNATFVQLYQAKSKTVDSDYVNDCYYHMKQKRETTSNAGIILL